MRLKILSKNYSSANVLNIISSIYFLILYLSYEDEKYFVTNENQLKCRDKANLKNGRIKTNHGHIYEEGAQVQFDCKVTYYISTKAINQCLVNDLNLI